MALNAKQARFVEEYPLDCNGTKAAIRAGYSQKNADKIASQLLGKTRVREAIDESLKGRAERTKIDADWVVQNLRNVYLEALAAKDFSATIRCLELLGKHVGAFEKHQTQKRPTYTPEDLAAIRRRLEEQRDVV